MAVVLVTRLLLIGLVCWPALASAQVAKDAVSSGSATSTSLTIAHTVAGSTRELICFSAVDNDATTTGITWDTTQNLTLIVSNEIPLRDVWVDAWKLVAPNTGTHNVVFTLSTSGSIVAACYSATGVNQTDPVGTTIHEVYSTEVAGDTNDTPSLTNGLVLDWIAFGPEGSTALAANGGQTVEVGPTTGGSGMTYMLSTKPGATTVTSGGTWTGEDFNRWAHVTVPLNPVGGGGGPGGGGSGSWIFLGVGR